MHLSPRPRSKVQSLRRTGNPRRLSDILQFDRYSGRLLDHLQNAKKSRLRRLIEANYDVHVGAIGGLTGKIIAFLASLICASLPVTGFLVWWLKRNRPRPAAPQNLTKTSHPLV